ncbi:hypothetical protein QBC38DRAFT_270190 [Podospora fimiseda]|uniref:AAA+ ATPase domain-containing protein n=1 Tax=Podospora fimiseda TaxID=252190 RepID=A0AAN7GUK9_9PEZI|nr:hypothetical protein QBC38DRAFT_270190 [Podospora fimiseda]
MNSPISHDGDYGRVDSALTERLRFLEEEIKFNRAEINKLDEKVATFEQPRRSYTSTTGPAHTEITDEADIIQEYTFLSAKKTIPKIRECSFAQFKNRFRADGGDGCYAVDVLVSGTLLPQEIEEEHKLRDKLFEHRGLTPATQIITAKDKGLAKAVKMANVSTDQMTKVQTQEKWPRRIRIQSPALLRILARVNEEKWTDRPRTYSRPFNSLIFQHPKMHQALEELEARWGAEVGPDSDDYLGNERVDLGPDSPNGFMDDVQEGVADSDEDSLYDSPNALRCMRAYVKYIDTKIIPACHQFDEKDVSSNATVRFSDLWYLFKTGELVYRQVEGELPDRRDIRTGKRIWKAYQIDSVPERLVASVSDDTEIRDAAVDNDDLAFTLACYYVDVDQTGDGEGFCIVKKRFRIEHFTGETLISALPIYPIRFCQDWEGRLEHSIKTGEKLISYMKTKHCAYSGWTLTRSPTGEPAQDSKGDPLLQPEHINSEVMVDFSEAFQQCPHWRPPRAVLRRKVAEAQTVQEEFRIRWWSGPNRAKLLGETTELIPNKSGVAVKLRNDYVSSDPFLIALAENSKRVQPTTEKDLTDDAKALLTGRVFGYVFQERKFALLAVERLRPSPKTGLALNLLKIPPIIKEAVWGSVEGHFLQKNAERKMEHAGASQDLIQGKGTGLFILLHGVPGVGKTATAEAIAQASGKPLFKITVGDLGMTPEKLETSLREIFRLASIWDCILLLDEVDTFFSQRSRADTATNKNALVSVFLRVLDYYDGILFLTTNRAGVLDEAFKSRIHYKINYQDLTLEQTLDIWKLNIQRVREIESGLAKVENRRPLVIKEDELLAFAAKRYNEPGDYYRVGRWNGRQIRNTFQVARSLAYYEYAQREAHWLREKAACAAAGKDDPPPLGAPILDVRHFETMYQITASFENYRVAIHGAADPDIALEMGYRDDNYSDPLTKNWQADYREQHHREAAVPTSTDGGSVDLGEPSARLQRPRDEPPVHDNFGQPSRAGHNLQHRHSFGSGQQPRKRSNSGVMNSPPPRYPSGGVPVPSPRYGPHRDSLPSIGRDYQSNYLATGSSPGGMSNYRLQPQYGTDGGPNNISSITPRGPSPGIGEGGVPLSGIGYSHGGRDYSQQEHYGGPSGANMPFSQSPVHARPGGGSWISGRGGGSGGGEYGYGGVGRRDSISRPAVQPETDLDVDEGYA